MPDAGVLATILLILGLFLLALELMIPSFGMIGILSAITLLVSAWCAWQAWWGTSPGFFWTYAAFWLLGIPSALGGGLFLLQNTRFGDRLVLRGPKANVEQTATSKRSGLDHLVGSVGVAKALLTPGGIVEVAGERHHAESPGMVIEPNTPIKVVGLKANRLIVKEYDPSAQEKTNDQPKSPVAQNSDALADTIASVDLAQASTNGLGGQSGDILDFDIPEN